MASKDRQLQRWSQLQQQPTLNELTCYICEFHAAKVDFKSYVAQDEFNAGTLYRYQCPQCQVIFGDLRFLSLSREEISRDYEDVYSYFKEGDSTLYILDIFDCINILDNCSTYLDFASGDFNSVVPFLKHCNVDIEGYDKHHDRYKCYPQRQFDVVFSCNYIEHVISPYLDIGEMLQLVKPGGVLLLISSCFGYNGEKSHYHTFFFSDTALDIIAKKLGATFLRAAHPDVRILLKDG